MARTQGAKDRTKRKIPQPVAEWRRCTARSKQTGQQCRLAAAYGGWVCRFHGGQIPAVIEATRQRLGAAVPLAVARLVNVLEYGDDRLACAVAKDLLDRLGLAAPVQLQAEVSVTTPEIEGLLASLADQKALSGPSREEQVVCSLAATMDLPQDASYEARLQAVFDSVVGHEGVIVNGAPAASSNTPAAEVVEDAVIVPPEPPALPPADDSVVLTNGQRWSGAALSPGGVRRKPAPTGHAVRI